ncbi:hypothetical protein PENSPDRAFT_689580 [Peniophora sp. CONT]|nr:hypothetical protein PENSPDRAFT_689580 [Peniophora sp. CONT]
MSTDPYHAVQSEIAGSLQAAEQLRASYVRIRSTARGGSEELEWARNELKATLAALEADLEDLDESVKIVESTGARMFGLEEAEVMQRRRYVEHVREVLETLSAEVEGRPPPNKSKQPPSPSYPASPAPEDDQAQWTREEQMMIMRQQDETLDTIGGTLSTIQQQAGLIGQEVNEHNEMLSDVERGVDQADSKLNDAMTKMKKFIRETEETKSGWCIGILIFILLCLLVAVIFI